MIEIRDFSNERNFPGTVGNDFDVILRKYDSIQKIPAIIFGIILFVFAIIPTQARWIYTFGLWGFFLLDWLLLWLLPKAGKSYGPPQPPVLLLAAARFVFAFLPIVVSIPLQIVGTFLVFYGFWIEPHRIKITRQTLSSQKIHPGTAIRILHLGDLHIERITQREKQLNQLIKELKPDVILFSGDILNLSYIQDPIAIEHARQIMQEWKAPYGSFGVSGSPAVDLDEVTPGLVKDLPVQWLNNQNISLEIQGNKLNILGIKCSHRPFIDSPILEELGASNSNDFSILLYHSPDLAPNADQLGIDLQLSGHTHGGQVCLPGYGALFTASLYGKIFEAGRYQLKNLVLYITRGIGMEGAGAPRVRFLCPPEIILWTITGNKSNE